MADIDSITLSSDKAKQGKIELGLYESIPLQVDVTGEAVDGKNVMVEIRRSIAEETLTISSFNSISITISGQNWNVNQYKDSFVNINIALDPPVFLKVASNTEDTLVFFANVDLTKTEYDLAAGKQIKITNIIFRREVTIVKMDEDGKVGQATLLFEQTFTTPYMGQSAVFGPYTAQAYASVSPSTPEPSMLEIYVVLMSIWQFKYIYFAGIPWTIENPNYPEEEDEFIPIFETDDVLYDAVRNAISEFEEKTQIFLTPKRVMTNPGPDDYCDLQIDPIDFEANVHFAYISLPHHHIMEIERIDGYFGIQRVVEWNQDWYAQNIDYYVGSVQMVPMLGGIPYSNQSALILLDFIGNLGWSEFMPGFWHLNYVTGWNERIKPIPPVFLQIIGQAAGIFLSPILGDALSPGIASVSLSMDGLSESESKTASAIYGLFSAKIEAFKKSNDKLWKDVMQSHVPLKVEVI